MSQQARPPQTGLSLETGSNVVGKSNLLIRRAKNELTGVKNKLAIRRNFHEARKVGLVRGRVNHRVLVIIEEAEEAIEVDIHRRRLDHLGIPRIHPNPAVRDVADNVYI